MLCCSRCYCYRRKAERTRWIDSVVLHSIAEQHQIRLAVVALHLFGRSPEDPVVVTYPVKAMQVDALFLLVGYLEVLQA